MIKVSTIPDIITYLVDICDFTTELANGMSWYIKNVADSSSSIPSAYKKVKNYLEDTLVKLELNNIHAKELTKQNGFDSIQEFKIIIATFIDTSEPEELFIEEELEDEEDENIVWKHDGFTMHVNNIRNANNVKLFKDGRKIGQLSTTGTYRNEDGTWLKVDLSDILKSYRGFGLGKQLYIMLLKHTAPEIKGVVSHLPNRYNTTTVPAIYKRLGGWEVDDKAFLPKQHILEMTKNNFEKSFNILSEKK